MKTFFACIISVCLLFGCVDKNKDIGWVDGYTPVYIDKAAVDKITMEAPQPIENGGKIATLGNFIYQVEQDKGIHIIDMTNPNAPVKTGFIKDMYCRELTLKGNYIYTNNITDLVVLDISDPSKVVVTKRIAAVFPDLAVQYPPVPNAFFECPDFTKGIILEWKAAKIYNPQCRKQ